MHFVEKYQNPVTARNNPKQLYSIFLVSIVVLGFLIITLQQIGTPISYLTYLAFGLLCLLYPVIGFLARTMKSEDFHFSGGRSHPVFNGFAIAGGAISGFFFVLLPGEIYHSGSSMTIWITGLVLGLAISGYGLSKPIAKQTAYTLPQLIVASDQPPFAGHALRFLLVIAVSSCSMLFAVAQLNIAKHVALSYLGMSHTLVVILILASILLCLVPGGLRGLTWSRAGSMTLIFVAFLFPIIWISFDRTNIPIPQLGFGTGALELLNSFERELQQQGFGDSAALVPIATNKLNLSAIEIVVAVSALAGGVAAMPHLLQHYATSSSVKGARTSGNWAICLCVLVLTAVPAYAAFLKLELFNLVVGLPIGDLEDLAPWLFNRVQFDGVSLAKICGVETATSARVIEACGQSEFYALTPADFELHSSLIIMEAQAIADLPSIVFVLISIGAFAAILTTSDGAILAAANVFSKDLICTLMRPGSPQNTILFLTRICLLLTAGGVGYLTLFQDLSFQTLLAASFSIAVSTLFPALVLRVTFPNCSNGVLLGIVTVGILGALGHLGSNHFGLDLIPSSGDEIRWFFSDKLPYFPLLFAGFFGAALAVTLGFALVKLSEGKRKPQVDSPSPNSQ